MELESARMPIEVVVFVSLRRCDVLGVGILFSVSGQGSLILKVGFGLFFWCIAGVLSAPYFWVGS